MTLPRAQLPSLWRISERICEALSAPKLVTLNFPNAELAETWQARLLPALLDSLRVAEAIDNAIELQVGATGSDPATAISEAVEFPIDDIEDLLYVVRGEPVIVLYWAGNGALPPLWQEFLRKVVHEFKNADPSRHYRKMIFVSIGNGHALEFLTQSPAINHLRLWNAITWEELRLYANEGLADVANEIRKSWMVSTYCGASNFDLGLLAHLVEARPSSISETLAAIKRFFSRKAFQPKGEFTLPERQFGRAWHPPPSLHEAWKSGSIIGASIERGFIRTWESQDPEKLEDVAYHLIWKEQVSGLFPLLIELGKEVNEVIVGGYAAGHLGEHNVVEEPGKILDLIRTHSIPLPKNLRNSLYQLKQARNHLAHLEPIERAELESIWDLHLRIRAGQH
jgi:hypothetical protein